MSLMYSCLELHVSLTNVQVKKIQADRDLLFQENEDQARELSLSLTNCHTYDSHIYSDSVCVCVCLSLQI